MADTEALADLLAERDRLRARLAALHADARPGLARAYRMARADVRELVECLSLAHRVIGQDWEDADGVPLREWHETSGALLAKHNPLQALADNAREMGLSYEDGSKT